MVAAFQAFAFICLLAETFGGKQKGFLSVDKEEADLWNSFVEDEKRLRSLRSSGAHGKLRNEYIPTPPDAVDADVSEWQKLHDQTVWLTDPSDEPNQPMIVNFSVVVEPGTSPCEQKNEQCKFDMDICRRSVRDLQDAILAKGMELHHTAKSMPLLNTLETGAALHRQDAMPSAGAQPLRGEKTFKVFGKASQEKEPAALAPEGLMPPRPMGSPKADDWAPTVAPKLTDDILAKQETMQTLHRRDLPDFELQEAHPRQHVSLDIAESIAKMLANQTAHHIVQHVNHTCSGDQTTFLNDCLDFVAACNENIQRKVIDYRALKKQLRDLDEELSQQT